MQLININEILSAFSLALDLAENKTFEHAQRTAYIAMRVAGELGLPNYDLKDIYAAALLHDIGTVGALADVHEDQNLILKHCLEGSEIVKTLPLSPQVSEYIRWHHANWDGSGSFQRAGNEIALGAQIVYLADQMDVRLKCLKNMYTERHLITDYLKDAAGRNFNPEIVDAFLKVQEREIFWLDYNNYNLGEVISRIQPPNENMIDIDGLMDIALTFARIIDNKSPFTHEHSQGLASWLVKLSAYYGDDEETTKMLKISGLLHDLGKLAIPNEILDKPGKLTSYEFQIIKGHTYYTKLILSKVKEFNVIKEWAANHHETLDGKGYPEGLQQKQLSKQEQMVAVCDVYQALTEDRPYRQPMAKSKVFEIIGDLVRKGKLSGEIFLDLKKLTA